MFEIVQLKELGHTCSNLAQHLKVEDGKGTRRVLLKGYLATYDDITKDGKDKFEGGKTQLFLWDQTAYIECVVPFKATGLISQEVLCTKWNLIVDGKEKWLELVDVSPCGSWKSDALSAKESIQPLVTVNTGVKIWQIRRLLQIDSVCIKGCVTCVTEVTKYKGSVFLLVKVEDEDTSLSILIQDQHFLWWQQILALQEMYIFTDLVPTSLKAGKDDCVLYVPTETSGVHKQSESNVLLTEYQSFVEEKCRALNVPATQCEQLLNFVFMPCHKVTQPLNVCTYKGKITSTVQRALGIFELDHKIRLYTNGARPLHRYEVLREGMEVTVYNAHHKGYPKPPKIRLCCCEWSCIQIEKIPLYEEKAQLNIVEVAESKMLRKYSHTMYHVEWILDTQQKLTEKLTPRIVRQSSIGFLLEKVLNLTSNEEQRKRLESLTGLLGRHDNCFVMDDKVNLPACISMKELCNMAKSLVYDDIKNCNGDTSGPQSSSGVDKDQIGWRVIQRDSGTLMGQPILIGQLKANKRTGNIQLVDLTGSVDCIICMNTLAPIDCFTKPVATETEEGQLSENSVEAGCHCDTSCDFVHVTNFGQLYLVKKFSLFIETLGVSDSFSEGVEPFLGKVHRVYIQFSMKDAVRLSTNSKSEKDDLVKHKDDCQRKDTNKMQILKQTSQLRKTNCEKFPGVACKKQKLCLHDEVKEKDDVVQLDDSKDHKFAEVENICSDDTTARTGVGCKHYAMTSQISEYEAETSSSHCINELLIHNRQFEGAENLRKHTAALVCDEMVRKDEKMKPVSEMPLHTQHTSNTRAEINSTRSTNKLSSCTCPATTAMESLMSSSMPHSTTSRQAPCVQQPFILLHKDSLQVKHQTTTQPKPVFYASACFIGRPYTVSTSKMPCNQSQALSTLSCGDIKSQSGGKSNSDNGSMNSSSNICQVALVFEESSVKWYHTLHVGQIYVLCKEKCADITVFQPRSSSQILKKAMVKSGAKMLLSVDVSMTIEEQMKEHPPQIQAGIKDAVAMVTENFLVPQVHTVAQLLQNNVSCEERLVSVCGVITGRRHVSRYRETQGQKSHTQKPVSREMYKLGALIPENYTIELTLRDVNTDATIRVFMNPETHLYQIGLMCGYQVLLYKLELKQSGSGSMYCQYLSASSCRIISKLKADWTHQQCENGSDQPKTPGGILSHISDVLFGNTGQITIFPTIQKVLKLSLKQICSKCSLMARPSDEDDILSCHCGNTHFQLKSQASVLVDDGTCNAMTYISGEMVWRLLGLNKQQELALETLVTKEGAILLDQGNLNKGSAAYRFCNALLASTQVRRRVSLKVLPRRSFFGSLRKSYKELTMSDVSMKKLQVGEEELHSYCFPLPQLDCVELSEINPTVMSKLLLY